LLGAISTVKLVAVVGGKHSGKTTVIQHLIAELKRRGYRVGAVKEMVRIPTLDTPQTETDRYTDAGAEVIVAVPRDETVVFIKKRLDIQEILPYLKGLDFAVLEGFESSVKVPRIIAAKTFDEVQLYLANSAIGVSGIIAEAANAINAAEKIKTPIFSLLTQEKELTDLVEQRALEI
jgi:molybdopterin-guanine dinucleotide biosynthesis adapter protein